MRVRAPHEAFAELRPLMADPDYRIYWADDLDCGLEEQDYCVVYVVPDGEVRHVVPVEYYGHERAYSAFWRLVRWNNSRLDRGR